MTDLAMLIQVQRVGDRFAFMVDGKPFPWQVTEASTLMGDGGPCVVLTVPADRVEFIDDAGDDDRKVPLDASAREQAKANWLKTAIGNGAA